MTEKSYSDEEAREILKRAVDFQEREDFQYSQQQLMDLGREMGLSNDAIVKAEQAWRQTARETPVTALASMNDTSGILATEEAAFRRHRMWEFQIHLVAFVFSILTVFIINLITNGLSFPWFLIVVFGWGIGLASHYMVARLTEGETYESAFDEWMERREDRLISRKQRLERLQGEE